MKKLGWEIKLSEVNPSLHYLMGNIRLTEDFGK